MCHYFHRFSNRTSFVLFVLAVCLEHSPVALAATFTVDTTADAAAAAACDDATPSRSHGRARQATRRSTGAHGWSTRATGAAALLLEGGAPGAPGGSRTHPAPPAGAAGAARTRHVCSATRPWTRAEAGAVPAQCAGGRAGIRCRGPSWASVAVAVARSTAPVRDAVAMPPSTAPVREGVATPHGRRRASRAGGPDRGLSMSRAELLARAEEPA